MKAWNDTLRRRWWPNTRRDPEETSDFDRLRAAFARLQTEHIASIDRLREVDHRAKNTLQLASAMLKLEARHAPVDCRAHLDSAAGRLWAMAQLERRLSTSNALNCEFADCLQIVADIYDGIGGARVEVEADGLACPVGHMTPLTLIANEAVTNALKHHAGVGVPHIRLWAHQDGQTVEVSIRDEGGGFGEASKDGFGLRMMRALSNQISGELAIASEAGVGTVISVRFPLSSPAH